MKIPKGQSESVYRRTENTMAKRKSTNVFQMFSKCKLNRTHIVVIKNTSMNLLTSYLSWENFLDKMWGIFLLLTRKLLNQGFLVVKLKSSLRQFYDHHHDVVNHYIIYVPQMTTDMFHLS